MGKVAVGPTDLGKRRLRRKYLGHKVLEGLPYIPGNHRFKTHA